MNRYFKTFFFLIVCLTLTGCSQPQTAVTTSFIVEGLQVIVKTVPDSPVVAGGFYLKGGQNYIGPRQAGIETLLFRTAALGSETLAGDELNLRLESMGTSFEVAAEYDYTGLTFRCNLANFAQSWDIFADVLLNPRFEPKELELVRQSLIATIESANDLLERNIRQLANDQFYDDHPYGVSPYGTSATIAAISRQDLLQYHHGDITKNRALLVMVGDLDLSQVTNMVRELTRQLPLGPEPRLPTLLFDPGSPDLTVIQRNLSASYILGLFPAPKPGHPDYPAFTAAMSILNDWLYEELVVSSKLAANPAVGFDQRIANHGHIQITTANPNDAVRAVFQTIDRLILDPLPDGSLKGAIATSTTRHLLEGESIKAQREQLVRWEIVGDGWQQVDQYLSELQSLQPGMIQAMIRKYLLNFHFVVVGNPQQLDRQLFINR